jgi:ferritin-like metal-binding protein YciE
MTKHEQFIQWLGDAHAMEVGIISTLEKHITDANEFPKLKAALTNHLQETKRHAAEMKKALESLERTHPVIKEGVSKIVSLVAGLATSAAKDTVIKNGIADFATEHFEIACYTSLILTATELGETRIATVCRGILKEEKAMAKTLEIQFKEVNAIYLSELDDDIPSKKSATTSASRKVGPRVSKAKSPKINK